MVVVVVVVGSMVGGTALTLPAFNCVPERDPPGLDIRAGVMTREQEWRKKKNRGRRYRLDMPRVRTYVLVDDVPGIVDQIDSNPRDEMRASIDLVKFDNITYPKEKMIQILVVETSPKFFLSIQFPPPISSTRQFFSLLI